MKLFIRQKVFSWTDQFTVKDEEGLDLFRVQGELFSFGKRLHIYHVLSGEEIATIEEKVWSLLPCYRLYLGEELFAQIVKRFTFLHPRYTVEGVDWVVEGDFWAHDYSIQSDGVCVAEINKQWMTWGDCYELNITKGEDAIAALAVVLAIDCVAASQNS